MSLLHAVLGFVAIQPMTGYELGKAFSTTAAHFWPADQSQLYRTLHRAEADGLVESTTVEQATRPDRRLYTLLEPGREALEAWLASPLEPDNAREPFLLRLFFAASLGTTGVIELLDQRRSAAVELLTTLDALASSAPRKSRKPLSPSSCNTPRSNRDEPTRAPRSRGSMIFVPNSPTIRSPPDE